MRVELTCEHPRPEQGISLMMRLIGWSSRSVQCAVLDHVSILNHSAAATADAETEGHITSTGSPEGGDATFV